MIAALFALAAAMIIGGCAAVIQGFPYVRLESGLAMVIAGSVAASSGAVLLGLGVVARGLRRLERAASRGAGIRAPEPAELPAAPEGRPRLPPVLPAVPGFVVPPAPAVEPPEASDLQRIAPSPRVDIPRVDVPQVDAPRADAPRPDTPLAPPPEPAATAEPELPIPGLAPAPHQPEPAPEAAAAEPADAHVPVEDDLFAAPEPRDEDPAEPPGLRPSLHAAPDPEPEPAPAPEAAPERKVVGRYASGGNTYVMFEDGAIEAETPQGRFTFASLDELKAFVDGGGETGARGAA